MTSIQNRKKYIWWGAFILIFVLYQTTKPLPPISGSLSVYKKIAGPIIVKSPVEDLSGLTYNYDTKTLFTVDNSKCCILELFLNGDLRRLIPTQGFHDIEGIVYLGNQVYYLIEERRGNICRFRITEQTNKIEKKASSQITIKNFKKNRGLEGISYDHRNDKIFVAQEKSKCIIYQVDHFSDGKKKVFADLSSVVDDISGLHYDANRNHLFVLSHESAAIIEMTTKGKQVGIFYLQSGYGGLQQDVPQAEGITFDDEGRLYVCSEPNLLYVFERPKMATVSLNIQKTYNYK